MNKLFPISVIQFLIFEWLCCILLAMQKVWLLNSDYHEGFNLEIITEASGTYIV